MYYNKKRALYGWGDGFDTETKAQAKAAGKSPGDSWEAKAPQFEVYSVDDNERIYFVLDDPDGLRNVPAPTPSDTSDIALLQAQVADLTAKLNQVLTLAGQPSVAAQQNPDMPQPVPRVDAGDKFGDRTETVVQGQGGFMETVVQGTFVNDPDDDTSASSVSLSDQTIPGPPDDSDTLLSNDPAQVPTGESTVVTGKSRGRH